MSCLCLHLPPIVWSTCKKGKKNTLINITITFVFISSFFGTMPYIGFRIPILVVVFILIACLLDNELICKSTDQKNLALIEHFHYISKRPFPSSLEPLFQNKSIKHKTFYMRMSSACREWFCTYTRFETEAQGSWKWPIQPKTLGNNCRVCGEPRLEIYCVRLNFNISKLGYLK